MGFISFWKTARQDDAQHRVPAILRTFIRRRAKASLAPATAFHYTPLATPTNIRLLDILPGKDDEQIQFSLTETSIDGDQEYFALSYTWGPPCFPRTISSATGCLKITESLFGALQELRSGDGRVRLWVDAICINQNDLEERSRQITLMRRIYSQSQRVLVWLGPLAPSDAQAFTFIRTFVDQYTSRINDSLNDSGKYATIAYEVADSDAYDTDNCQSLTRLFERGWFSRTWTYQEITSASSASVFCGSLSIHYDYLSRFAMLWSVIGAQIQLLSGEAQTNVGSIVGIAMVKEHVGVQLSPMTSLFELLRWTQSRQATDPRDKVYSLISMATDIRPLPYPPTYKISAATLYFDLAEHMVSQQKGLDILGQCVFQSKGRRNPSWVPDWSKGAMPAFDLGVGTIPYCASGSYACNAVVPKGRKQLLVEGFHYDQIEELSESHMELSSNHAGGKDRELLIPILKKQKVVLQDSLRIVSSSPRYSCEAQRSEAFSRTMVGDRRQDGTQVSKDFERTVWEFRETVDRLIAANIDLDSINILEHGNIETRLVYMASGRRFCLTQSGLVGWVPRDARKGDSVSLLCGSKVPIVLRSKGDAYLVVGQCYIHGIMDGEALIGFTSKFKTMHLA